MWDDDCTCHISQRVLSAVAGRPGHRQAPDGPPGCLPLSLERREGGARESAFARLRGQDRVADVLHAWPCLQGLVGLRPGVAGVLLQRPPVHPPVPGGCMEILFQCRSGYSKWKNRYQTPSFPIPDNVRVRDDQLAVPRVGWLPLRRRGGNPYPDGEAVKAVVRREGKRWYATICCKVVEPLREHDGHAIGVDRNVGAGCRQRWRDSPHAGLATAGRETQAAPAGAVPQAERLEAAPACEAKRDPCRTAPCQRPQCMAAPDLPQAGRKGGNRGHREVEHQGHDALCQAAKEDPGKNVRQEAGLNRVILHTGWSAMERMLDCKALEVIRVPAAYISQTCSACGVVVADSRRSQESFECEACGQAQNADLNAARNILASATGASARRGAFTSVTPRTRKMDTGYTIV